MKLKTLAIAVAVASMPFAAQADLKISGDVGAAYYSSSETIEQFGSEVNFDASEKIGGLTYGGHMGLQYGESGGASLNEGRVTVDGGFGTVTIGHQDNGCNILDIGGTNEVILTHTQGGCAGNSDGLIEYKRGMGPATFAISHHPGSEQTALGVSGTMGPVGISLGYETEIEETAAVAGTAATAASCTVATEALLTGTGGTQFCSGGSAVIPAVAAGAGTAAVLGNNIVLGLTGKVGPVSVGFRANKVGDNDAVHGVNALYSAGAHNIYGGLGTSDGNDSKSLGYKHVRGSTDFIIEASDSGAAGSDTDFAIGMRHRF